MKIKFSTENELALKHFSPVPAKKLIPDWYKQLPFKDGEMNALDIANDLNGDFTKITLKGCIPVADYLTSGYILRTTSDIIITPELTDDGKHFWWASRGANIGVHGHGQCPIKINKTKNTYIKFMSDWRIETPEGYSCYFYQPEFFFEDRFKLLPGIVDTDAYTHEVNFPGVILAEETFTIEAGTPLMVVFPFKREDWVSDVGLLTKKTTNPIKIYIERAYKKLFHKQKNFD